MAVVVKQKQPTATADIVPPGTYPAILTGIRQFDNAYGHRIGFEFTLQGDEVDGMKVMRSTSPNLSAKSKLADMLRGLLGRGIEDQEINRGVDIEELVGTECKVLVLQSRSKSGQVYSNVEQVFR
jgi:hypothetical protein